MRSSPDPDQADDLDLDLPAFDGEGEDDDHARDDDLASEELDGAFGDLGDALDDAASDDPAALEVAVEGAEAGWLVDADDDATLDVGPFDVVIEPEGKILEDDEADGREGLDDLVSGEESFVADAGEEGPLAEDEELREEDLPALDADEDGDVPDDALYDRSLLAVDDDLRWDDRAWARVPAELGPDADDADDSGVHVAPGDDPTYTARDATWRDLDETGRVMAASLVPGGSVVLAVQTSDRTRALLVRIQPDGRTRIIAEVDPRSGGADDESVCRVHFVRWDRARGCLFVGGSFGVEAYRPA